MLIRSPRLMFNTDPDVTSGADPVSAEAPNPEPAETPKETAFPANTAVKDMTPEEQAAYWKYHARKHENAAIQAARDLAAAQVASQTDQEKHEADLIRQGEEQGAKRFLKDAVAGHIRALTGKSDEEIEAALGYLDVTKFVDGNELNKERVEAYAKTLGLKANATPSVPLNAQAAAMAGIVRPGSVLPGARSGGSIQDRRKELREQLAARSK